MFWNKIPKGYVETVDGYIVKESECKSVIVTDDFVTISSNNGSRKKYYRKEVAPKHCIEFNSCNAEIISIKENGTPIGYYSKEEVEKLEAEIKELKNKYEPITAGGIVGILDEACTRSMGDYYPNQVEIGKKPKKKGRGRPKGSKNKK